MYIDIKRIEFVINISPNGDNVICSSDCLTACGVCQKTMSALN